MTAKTEKEIRASMTSEQIQLERKLTCEAIEGAMAFGYQNTNPPPSDDHWLAPFWKIGRKQAELEAAAASALDRLTAEQERLGLCEPVADDGDYVKHEAVINLRKFLNAAGGEGFVLDGVDGGSLFMSIFDFEEKVDHRFVLAAQAASNATTPSAKQEPIIGSTDDRTAEQWKAKFFAEQQHRMELQAALDCSMPEVATPQSVMSDKQEVAPHWHGSHVQAPACEITTTAAHSAEQDRIDALKSALRMVQAATSREEAGCRIEAAIKGASK